MVDVSPTTAQSSSTQTVTALNGVTPIAASISSAPDKIQQLPRQIQVTGPITQIDNGTITLSTVLGQLSVVLPTLTGQQQDKLQQQLLAMFQTQKPLTVLVQPGNPPSQTILLLPPASSSSTTGAIQNNALLQAMPQISQPLTAGQTLSAIVLPSIPSFPSNVAQQQPSIPATPTLQTPVINSAAFEESAANSAAQAQQEIIPTASFVAEPTVSSAPQTATAPTIAPQQTPQQSVAQPAQTASLSTPTPLLQAGNEVVLRVDAVVPPPAGTATAQAAIAAAQTQTPAPIQTGAAGTEALSTPVQIVATVTGNAPNGQLIVKAGDATLFIKQNIDAPAGTTLLISVEQAQSTGLMPLQAPDTQNFTGLQPVLAAIAQASPQVAQQVLENRVPQITEALPGALLFFMSALKQGNPMRSWLGDDAVETLLRAGKFDLIDKLMHQLDDMGQPVRDNVVGEWRSYPIPLHNNGQFQMLNFYVHGDGGRHDGKNAASGKPGASHVRFLIDMSMSRLGPMQIDGLVQPKKLDMIVRSQSQLPTGFPNELRSSYIKTLEAIGYAGSLNFQIGKQHWLAIQKATTAPAGITT